MTPHLTPQQITDWIKIAEILDFPNELRLLEEIKSLNAELTCDGCLGTGTSLSGPCGCGGSGRLSDMLMAVREELAALRVWKREAREELRAVMKVLRPLEHAQECAGEGACSCHVIKVQNILGEDP